VSANFLKSVFSASDLSSGLRSIGKRHPYFNATDVAAQRQAPAWAFELPTALGSMEA